MLPVRLRDMVRAVARLPVPCAHEEGGTVDETPAHVEAAIARALHRGTRPLPARLHGSVGGAARGGEREGDLSEGVDVG